MPLPLPVRESGRGRWQPYAYYVGAQTSTHSKQHLDRFSRFGTAHARDQQTNRLADHAIQRYLMQPITMRWGGSIAEWLACWTQAQKGPGSNRNALSGNSLRQTVHTHCTSVHQAAKLVADLLRVTRVTADLAESNGSLPSGL